MTRQALRRIIKDVLLTEARDEAFGGTQTKTKTALDQEIDDLFNDAPAQVPDVVMGRGRQGLPGARQGMGARPGAPVRGGVTLDDMSGITDTDIMDMLSSIDTPQNFNFESEFQKGLEQGVVRGRLRAGRQGRYEGDDEGENPPGNPDPPQKYFPVYDLAGKLTREEVAEKSIKALMDEFVAPAMALGQRVLPTVWAELSRLMKKDMRGFMTAFQVSLNMIRETENTWFSKLLGIAPPPPQNMNVPAETMEMAMRIKSVLDIYYNAVLQEAAKNQENLINELQAIEAMTDRTTFELGFFDALSQTRDVEDKAFATFMGGPARLTMRR